LQHRRLVLGLPEHGAPFLKPLFLVPITVVGQGWGSRDEDRPRATASAIAAPDRASTASMSANSASNELVTSERSIPSPSTPVSASGSTPTVATALSAARTAPSAHPTLLARLKTCEPRRFANQVPFLEYLAANGIDIFDQEIIRPFAEAGIWGAIRHHGLVGR